MKTIHYGWFVCLGCALLLFCTSGLCVNAFTVYQPYIMYENGLTNAQSSTILTVRSLFSFLSMFLTGTYYKKLSLRNGMTLAGILVVMGFLVFGLAKVYLAFCLAAMLMGIGFGLGTMIPIAIVLEHWFVRKRTLAIGICSAATGISTLGIPSLITWSVEKNGLSVTFFAEAGVTAVLVLLSWLLIRNDPTAAGMKPYGADLPVQTVRSNKNVGVMKRKDWLQMVSVLLLIGATTSVGYSHLSVLVTAEGFSAQTAALVVTVSGVVMTVSKCIFGGLTDRLSVYKCNWIFGVIQVAGLALLCVTGTSRLVLFGAISAYGAGLALTTVGMTAWAGDLSAPEQYDRNIRRFQIAYAGGTMLFSSFPGLLADRFGGSYVPAYAFFAVCAVFVLLSVQSIYRRNGVV